MIAVVEEKSNQYEQSSNKTSKQLIFTLVFLFFCTLWSINRVFVIINSNSNPIMFIPYEWDYITSSNNNNNNNIKNNNQHVITTQNVTQQQANNVKQAKKLQLQATHDPSTEKKFTLAPNGIVELHRVSHGFGHDLLEISRNLRSASMEGKELRLRWHHGWKYTKDADCIGHEEYITCFFEPPNVTELVQHPPKGDNETLRLLLKPNQRTQKELDHLGHLQSPTPCGVIHVRHADIVLNRGWHNKSRNLLKYLDLGLYFDAFRKNAPSNMKNIVLLTDDQNVIDEVPLYNGTDGFHFHYIQRKRFRGAEGGWENHFPSGSPKGELLTLLRIREFVSNCSLWVGTISSFARVMQLSMIKYPKIVRLNNKYKVVG